MMEVHGEVGMLQRLLKVMLLSASAISVQNNPKYRCLALKNSLSLPNTIILDVQYTVAGTNVRDRSATCQLPPPFPSGTTLTADACRIYAVTNTTDQSAVHFEMWLPNQWDNRFLAVGNGGLGGCIDYGNLDYGNSLNFATIGSDNGHDGNDGIVFLNRPEVIKDFAYRAIHTEAVIGKQIAHSYYKSRPKKSYYLGCSTGGRQGVQAALRYPEDFDGIIAGAPATDFNHLIGWTGMLSRFVGAPNATKSPSFITADLWTLVSAEILRQCDGLDGVEDGVITEPDQCIFRPEALLCSSETATNCLTGTQVQTLKNIYQPLYGTKSQMLYPRYDPGAEADGGWAGAMGGDFFNFTNDWTKYAIYNDTNHTFESYGVSDIEFSDTINPGGISTWNGDLSQFRNRGGKLITYHGRRDPLIASGNSKRLYDLITTTMGKPILDDFYRLFLIPGMSHCGGGVGSWAFGQGFQGALPSEFNSPSHNVLLAVVDWVERGQAPDTIVGVDLTSNATRTHCRYPQRSVWDGSSFVCKA